MIETTRTLRATIAISLLLTGATVVAATGPKTTPAPGPGYGYGFGPGMMGPGGMYNWTPQQRQQHWRQMRQYGYGPGMMGPGWGGGPGGWGRSSSQ
jgi:Spy/CpxP family protein refolding chaperone